MTKQLTIIAFFCVVAQIYSQEKRTIISGKINSELISVTNIHVLNKAINIGTITNESGEFKISVKVNDTLIFSGIQFYKKELLITKELLKNKFITVELFQKINELDEVEVKAHNLSGNLITDAKNVKDSVSKVGKGALDFSMIDFSKPVVLDIDEMDRQAPPNASALTNPNIPVGGNVLGLLKFALNPLFKEMGKIGQHRRQRKKEEKIYQQKAIDTPEKIITELGETFFTEKLKIPREEITDFINHCKSKNIINLYLEGQKIEVIDILIKESYLYRK